MIGLRPTPTTEQEPARLRIAMFSGNYNYTRDGANRALNKLVGRLIERGAAVRVYSPTSARPAFDPVGTLVSVPSFAIPGRPDFRMALGLPRHVRDDIDRFSPSLIHVSAPDFLGTGAQKYAHKRGVPVVASYHTRFESYFEYYRMGFLRAWARERQARFYRSSRRVLAPNSAIIGELQDMGLEQNAIRLWGRGVDIRKFNPRHRDLGWRCANGFADPDVVVTFLGRLVLEKGIRLFASVIDMLVSRGCKVRPLVIGSGPAEGAFRALLPDALFIGHLDGTALSAALASSDILLHPSKTEAFGNVVLEAMASGVAVVSPDVPSASALITNRIDGLLLGTGASDLASGVQWLVNHPSARQAIGQAATRSAARYQWDAINDAAIASYLEITPREDCRTPIVANLEDEPPETRDTVCAAFSHQEVSKENRACL